MSGSVLKGVNHNDPVAVYRGERILRLAKRLGIKLTSVTSRLGFAIDLFYSMYLPYPVLLPLEEVDREGMPAYMILRAALESDDFNELRISTIADSTLSTLLSASLIDALSKELGDETAFGQGTTITRDRGIEAAVRRAVSRVKGEARAIKDIRKLLSRGNKAGVGSVFDLEESGEDVIRLARNEDIQNLLEILSLMPEVARMSRRKVMPFSRGELRGYDIGSDLERIAPTELALPKLLFRLKYVESKLLLYEKVITKDMGPVYVLVDKSGSMEGEKIRWAKATALALLMKSMKERRDYYLRFFDGAVHDLISVSRKLNPKEALGLLKYLARVRSGGGTDITKAVDMACSDMTELSVRGLSDVILITDGEDNVSDLFLRRRLRKANARLITVMIAGENRSLRKASDSYLRVTKLGKEEILRVVEA